MESQSFSATITVQDIVPGLNAVVGVALPHSGEVKKNLLGFPN